MAMMDKPTYDRIVRLLMEVFDEADAPRYKAGSLGGGLVASSDAAIELGMSREAVVRLVQSGKIAGRRERGRYFVELNALRRWRAVEGGPPPPNQAERLPQ